MPSLDKAFSDFLKALRGEQSYASLASKLGIAESTLYRLTNRQQSATLRKIEKILSSQNLSLADVFGEEVSMKILWPSALLLLLCRRLHMEPCKPMQKRKVLQ